MPEAFGSQRSARITPPHPTSRPPATASTYTVIRRGVVLAESTVAPGQSHDVAWGQAQAAWAAWHGG